MDAILRGIILGLSITAPLGPTNVEVIRRGLKEGWKSAFIFCIGVMVALLLYLALVAFGLSFLAKSREFGIILSIFGVAVLCYLAYNAMRDFFNPKKLPLDGKAASRANFVPGIILTISNPAVLLLWTGIIGADLSSQSSPEQGLLLSFGILVGVLAFFIFLTALIRGGRKFINQKNFRYISLAAGLVLLYFALSFGYQLLSSLK